jgi:transcriptional regulator with XRE-family HTH domain
MNSSSHWQKSHSELALFLKHLRKRIDPDVWYLGQFARLRSRIGRPVTQQELAEAIGVSQNWCAKLESAGMRRISIGLAGRLADALMVTPEEQARLFRLAVPELRAGDLGHESIAVYEAMPRLRQTVKRLFGATSETEIFHIAGEEARGLLPCFDAIYARRGVLSAREDAVVFRRPGVNQAKDYTALRKELIRRLTPEVIGRVDASWQHSAAGDLVAYEAYPPEFVELYRLVLHEQSFAWESILNAHIRGRGDSLGMVGGLSSRPHDVTDLERAALSAIAGFASLALG